MYCIMICDDDRDIRNALKIYLSGEGYKIIEAENGSEALELLKENEVHLVLMDVMMPKLDGVSATAKLREEYNLPVIILTAKSEDTDKIFGLAAGADDYITKPFNPLEVIARVKAQLRRYAYLGGMEQKKESTYSFKEIELDDETKNVTIRGESVYLTPTEYDILKLFLENPGKVFSSKEIYSYIWNTEPLGAEGTIAVHIRHLREKLEIDPANPRHLKVVWGKGYKLEGGK